ncbi:MAG TPA: tetratricopeptide repeat protein [Vicinamibacteria bacterium]|jgi:tetratricopeptide (TPR) repeat protein
MRVHRYVLVAAAIAMGSSAFAQDWKGMGRLEGRVLDADGKPLPDVTVKMNLPSRGGGTTLKTDKKGHWAIGGIAAGAWEIDLSAPGYVVKKITLNLPSESARLAPVDVKLEKAAAAGPPPEVRAALEKGDAAFKEGRFAEARTEYEKLLALRPEIADTLYRQIAFTYSREGNYAKEVEYLDKVLQSNPTDPNLKLLTAQEALRGGMLDKGLELLKGIDDSSIKEPEVFYNVAALLLNAQKPEDAIRYLSKAVTVDPAYVDAYFQRGLAYLGLQKTAEAKADFQKVIDLAPTGAQAETAKKALQQLK